jgi:hypothetical protein
MEENIKAYSEACNTIRHYSNASLSIRLLTIVQGVVILVAWIVNFHQSDSIVFGALPIFGLLFTFLLFLFYNSYYRTTSFFYNLTSKMEDTLFDEDFRPFKMYNRYHHDKYKTIWSKIIYLWSPFLLIGLLFFIALTIAISRLCVF